MRINDLREPQLLIESRTALDELFQILFLGAVYRFQQSIVPDKVKAREPEGLSA
ncbi:N-succinylarginine dihydrolase [Colwellia sp. MB02u-6]|nr:N-succinylarginine dihydrolase [Colwellia sp. MB02u-6]